ncbi:ABC transporter ATP-binding protein [Lentzea flaviverrucosa]|uniref:ABC-2 type transport system ATP-binding protein n=1 Tax=Lentzea flaviverrucosa TaxID=200379 RepID=A0A1H9SEK3_9PSEU|nr:ABC transporter ATP-binding protein [Lentzea flaviverrucosa]RDI25342.1 ABC-2 type transport system ATP-binding protein [Lentzea flaviverrucosa]SER83442.1 ABC-2 type transport system ATP-binding protein [Lentzea flaviverrucosa]
MTRNDELALDVEGLRMRYGSTDVLHDVTLQVRRGEVVCLLGPNGAGKTTTIEILEGFRMRSAGRVSVLGVDPASGDEAWRARVGVVLQSWRDHARWRIRELLQHQGSYYAPYSDSEVQRPWDADELIAAVGLTEHAHKKLRMLSGGQRRRVDVAIGMVGKPELIFLDEPTAGLDPEARREFHSLVAEVSGQGHTTIVLTTHDLAEAEKLATRIMILDGGRIVADGTAAELRDSIAGEDQVSWTLDGERHTESTTDATKFIFDLFKEHGDAVADLDIKKASLEDTYLTIVSRAEERAQTDTIGGAA